MKCRKLPVALSLAWFGAMLSVLFCGLLFGKWTERIVQQVGGEVRLVLHPNEDRSIAPSDTNFTATPRRVTSNSKAEATTSQN